jgi:hypothetical protein
MRFQTPAWLVNGLALLLSVAGALGQGNFVNLGFESARIILDPTSPYYPGAVQASNAIPGWTLLGGVANPDVLYNDVSLGAPAVSIHDTGDSEGFPPIQGNYSVYIQGLDSTTGIAQTGQIPANARSLTFLSYFTRVDVTFNGQAIPYGIIGTGPNYTIYGGDISAFAGQTGQLRFSGNGGMLDNIQFSNLPIPEPGVFGLAALGALLLGWRLLLRRR